MRNSVSFSVRHLARVFPNQHPNSHDYQELVDIYAHTDSTNTNTGMAVDPAPAAVGLAEMTNPEEWGEHIGESPSGNTHHFERDFGEFKIITSVTWAPEP